MNKFKELGIDNDTLKVIESLGYDTPTEIQEKSIPLIIEGKDIIAQSATGTGKTLAFLSGIVNKIDKNKKIQALVITPTRELAIQIYKEGKILSKHNKINYCVVYGGESVRSQAMDLKSANIVIATPGRLLDHIKRGNLSLNNIKYIVLDEADRMSDMGFIDDIKKILKETPKEKQMLLFSATITKDVNSIEKNFMNYPIRVSAQHYVDKVNLIQEYYKIPENKKLSLLVDLLSKNKDKKAIVFCNTRSNVDMVEHNLIANGIESYKLHGGLEQRKRTHITALYHKHKSAILVSTDVAARGIHIEDVEYIYNFDLPKEKTQYIHRIGRTARAGKQGKAISFVSQRNLDEFLKMGKKYKFDIKKKELPDFKQLDLIKVKNGFLGRSSKGSLRDLSSRSNRKELYTSKKKSYFDKRINMFKKEIEDSKNKQLDRKENKQKYFNEKEEKFKKKQIFDRIKYKKKLRQKKYSK